MGNVVLSCVAIWSSRRKSQITAWPAWSLTISAILPPHSQIVFISFSKQENQFWLIYFPHLFSYDINYIPSNYSGFWLNVHDSCKSKALTFETQKIFLPFLPHNPFSKVTEVTNKTLVQRNAGDVVSITKYLSAMDTTQTSSFPAQSFGSSSWSYILSLSLSDNSAKRHFQPTLLVSFITDFIICNL